MKKRIFIGVALIGVMAIVALLTFAGTRNRPDVVYHGKTAQQWLDLVFTDQQSVAMEAFKKMGTNALPTLMDAFRQLDKDTRWDKTYAWFYRNVPAVVQGRMTKPITPQQSAMRVSSVDVLLMNNLEVRHAAIPDLVEIGADKKYPFRSLALIIVANSVGSKDVKLVPVLAESLSDSNLHVRKAVCSALGRIGPAAKVAVPELISVLRNPDMDTRVMAALALWKVDGQTNVAVAIFKEAAQPATSSMMKNMALIYLHQINPDDASLIPLMVERLDSPTQEGKIGIVTALGTYGPAAAAAVPALKKLVKSRDQDMYWQALSALRRIDPDTAAQFKSE